MLRWWYVAACWCLCFTLASSSSQWIINSCNEATCVCQQHPERKNLFNCSFVNSSNIASTLSNTQINCNDLPKRKLQPNSIHVDCGQFGHCGTVQLQAVGSRWQWAAGNPLVHFTSFNCGVNDSQLLPTVPYNFSVAPFGIADVGIGGFLWPEPKADAGGDCQLMQLSIHAADGVLQLPRSLLLQCPRLSIVNITDSQVAYLQDADLLATGRVTRLRLSGCNLLHFGTDLLQQSLSNLTTFVQKSNCTDESPICNATVTLRRLLRTMGSFVDVRALYLAMQQQGVNFSLVLGSAANRLNVISDLDLSSNQLNDIPAVVSMMGQLTTLNLSRNRISDLYSSSFCWRKWSDIGSQEQCYWFWAARDTLRKLDLSHNRISVIATTQPWFQTSLLTLDLSHNELIAVHPESLMPQAPSLKFLRLANNRLKWVELHFLDKLEVLSVSNNEIGSITNRTIPTNSTHLFSLMMSNNNISSIQVGVFHKLQNLRELWLDGNKMEVMWYQSFRTSPRSTLQERVNIRIGNQRPDLPYCNCQHFHLQSLIEVGTKEIFYQYPRIAQSEMNNEQCRVIQATKENNVGKKLMKNVAEDEFLCKYDDFDEIFIPPGMCNTNDTNECFGECNHGCVCFRLFQWYSMNCSGCEKLLTVWPISLPLGLIDLSNANRSDVTRFTNKTLTWTCPKYQKSLVHLQIRRSGVVEIEDYAFNGTNIRILRLENNHIQTLTGLTFAGLEDTLNEVTLNNNRMTTISVLKVFGNFKRLGKVTLQHNWWQCSCRSEHLKYLKEMQQYWKISGILQDYNTLTCNLTDEFRSQFTQWRLECIEKFSNVIHVLDQFTMQDVDLLVEMCDEIAARRAQVVIRIVQVAGGCVCGIAVCVLAVLGARRRHMLCSLIAYSTFIKFLMHRRRQVAHRQHWQYDVFIFYSEGNEQQLQQVMDELSRASERLGVDIRICVTSDFASTCRDGEQVMLCRQESIEEAVRCSSSVLVLLSEELMFTKQMETVTLLQCLGRRMESELVILQLAEDREELVDSVLRKLPRVDRDRQEGMRQCMRLLLGKTFVQLGSVDWQFQLLRRIFQAGRWHRGDDDDLERDDGDTQPLCAEVGDISGYGSTAASVPESVVSGATGQASGSWIV